MFGVTTLCQFSEGKIAKCHQAPRTDSRFSSWDVAARRGTYWLLCRPFPELQRLCAKVDKICQRSGVDYMLPTALQPEGRPPGTEAKLPGSGDSVSFPAASMDVQVGALSLPRLTAIEVGLAFAFEGKSRKF